jgi:hypothetical protein
MKRLILAGFVLAFAGPALAQSTVPTTPGTSSGAVVQGGSPGVANSGPGATGTVAPGGTGAPTINNNSAGAGNANQPERAVPQTGGGGGSGSGGGGG